jgi:pyruvate dehydrogenase E1 component
MATEQYDVLGGDINPRETQEWLDSLEYTLEQQGPARARFLLDQLTQHANATVDIPFTANTPYINTIPPEDQPDYPGDRAMERRIRNIIRWNALVMVVRGNKEEPGIGGHISTYQSAAALYEVGFNHFFRASTPDEVGDIVYFQGHASPGIYARAFLEGRLTEDHLRNFRRELRDTAGLSSYPHPWLMPDFWQFPSVSMGLSPIMSIYQARYNRYLHNRGLADTSHSKVWGFVGDGECDEPETLGSISLAARERLDNLVWVINCNLQRLDGPVRGNGKIIQELEAVFRGAGWNVIKVIWGDKWDPLLEADQTGLLKQRMMEVVDGQYQKYTVESGEYIREDFFGAYPELLKLVEHLTDEEIRLLPRGGHDHKKIYAAFKRAVEHTGQPTVILAKTVKGYGLGEAGEGRNVAHNQKSLESSQMLLFRDRFKLPIPDGAAKSYSFYHPGDDSPEIKYLRARRQELKGSLPRREVRAKPLKAPPLEFWQEFLEGTGDKAASTTMAFVRMLGQMLRDKTMGELLVPIIPDEARTFGMEPLFRQCGIYSSTGQLYEPVDKDTLLYYREAKDGQILEEGICEAGAMGSFIAAGTAYATHGVNTIPFYTFYSMFGFQRVGDLIWAGADTRVKGFLLGATAGRTTLNGEGLQHEDGHSHLIASTVPNCRAYDPAFAFEIAVLIQDGIHRMYQEQRDEFYYITLMNENYVQPAMPTGAEEGIRRGMYLFREPQGAKAQVQLFGSGTIMQQVLQAQELLAEQFDIAANVWSLTSYTELRRDALSCERHNRWNPGKKVRTPYVTEKMHGASGPVIAASDYVSTLPDLLCRWIPATFTALGTDGFGRSESRPALRNFFEVDAAHITAATLSALARDQVITPKTATAGIKKLGIDVDAVDPWTR